MRRAARVDSNQAEIVKALRLSGVSTLLLHRVGQGCPDILAGSTRPCPNCGYGMNYNWLIELKDGSKKPSAQKLTPDEQAFHESWRGQVATARTIEEALRLVGKID